jgi:hypothetical protein
MENVQSSVQDLGVIQDEERLVSVSEEMREVDVLDLMMIEAVTRTQATRKHISEVFEISKDKARTRLEDLFERKLINKAEICVSCENVLPECSCGSYNKGVYYFREGDEEDAEFISQMRKLIQELDSEEK